MNFFKVITSATVLVLSLISTTAQAQKLPKAHSQVAEDYINVKVTSESFLDKAYIASRHSTPFEAVDNKTEESFVNIDMANRVIDYAAKFLGTRYVWGATGPSSFDCSGFTSYVYRNFGISLNRTSSMQYTQGEKVSLGSLQPGDLLFFSSHRSGRNGVGHVAMVVSVDKDSNTCTFIHASTKKGVTYQKFPDNGYYSDHFIGAKRILGSSLDVATR